MQKFCKLFWGFSHVEENIPEFHSSNYCTLEFKTYVIISLSSSGEVVLNVIEHLSGMLSNILLSLEPRLLLGSRMITLALSGPVRDCLGVPLAEQ